MLWNMLFPILIIHTPVLKLKINAVHADVRVSNIQVRTAIDYTQNEERKIGRSKKNIPKILYTLKKEINSRLFLQYKCEKAGFPGRDFCLSRMADEALEVLSGCEVNSTFNHTTK